VLEDRQERGAICWHGFDHYQAPIHETRKGRWRMEIEPKLPTTKGPAARFTGDVWVDPIATRKPEPSRMVISRVRFAPGAHTAWHFHAVGQTLHITEGVALIGTRDGRVVQAYPGQTVYTPPGEHHWHGATSEHFMEHLAMLEEPAEGEATVWLEHVTDEEYARR
jgi:quercetin dioxygenase-like cupin family protein